MMAVRGTRAVGAAVLSASGAGVGGAAKELEEEVREAEVAALDCAGNAMGGVVDSASVRPANATGKSSAHAVSVQIVRPPKRRVFPVRKERVQSEDGAADEVWNGEESRKAIESLVFLARSGGLLEKLRAPETKEAKSKVE